MYLPKLTPKLLFLASMAKLGVPTLLLALIAVSMVMTSSHERGGHNHDQKCYGSGNLKSSTGSLKFTWKIEDFSNLQTKKLYSDVFSLGPYKWRILAYPQGNNLDNYLSIFLEVADSKTLPSSWNQNATFSLTLINQTDNKVSVSKVVEDHEFKEKYINWGFRAFISHKELNDPKKGYLVKDTCIIEADVIIHENDRVESCEGAAEVAQDVKLFTEKEELVEKQKEMIKLFKELREELEMLVNYWPEDEKEGSSKMKQLVSSLKKSFYSKGKPQTKQKQEKIERMVELEMESMIQRKVETSVLFCCLLVLIVVCVGVMLKI